jgi:hypothetical protein
MDGIIIRKAAREDLDIIGILWQEFMDFHKQRDAHFTRSTDGHELFRKFIAERMDSDNSYVLVAEEMPER